MSDLSLQSSSLNNFEISNTSEAPGLSGPLLPMDLNCLTYLVEVGGRAPFIAIPAKLFKGEIPADRPDLIDLGLIAHECDDVVITDAGRAALLTDALKNFTEGRDISYVAALENARAILGKVA